MELMGNLKMPQPCAKNLRLNYKLKFLSICAKLVLEIKCK